MQAQSLAVYSELQRVGPDGEIIGQDRAQRPREVLSPKLARNAYTSFHLVAFVPAASEYELHVGQNPENAVRVAVYREVHGPDGIPDRLEPVKLPVEGKTAKDVHLVLWMDLWVDPAAPARRIKVEPQLLVGQEWVIYPMEANIIPAIVPPLAPRSGPLPAPQARADAAVMGPLRGHVCGTAEPAGRPEGPTVRSLIHRNAQQDMALARNYYPREAVHAGLLAPAGVKDAAAWCKSKLEWLPDTPAGAEWYLRARDFLYRFAPYEIKPAQ